MIKYFLCAIFTLQISAEIYDVKTNSIISMAEFKKNAAQYDVVVMGETHYKVAETEAQIIKELGSDKNFSLFWEFLDYTDQGLISQKFKTVNSADFLNLFYKKESYTHKYETVLDTVAKLNGRLYGANLPRELKDIVVKKGISALDPQYIPPGFHLGTREYFQRFYELMKGHVQIGEMANYFWAQCLVDGTAAYHLTNDDDSPLKFLIIGLEHSKFFDASVSRIKEFAPEKKILSIIVTDEKDLPLDDPKYGAIADYVFVNK